jgi:hypothetical protein
LTTRYCGLGAAFILTSTSSERISGNLWESGRWQAESVSDGQPDVPPDLVGR